MLSEDHKRLHVQHASAVMEKSPGKTKPLTPRKEARTMNTSVILGHLVKSTRLAWFDPQDGPLVT